MSTVQLIPIAKIRVLNPRTRNRAKFSEIVKNISEVGLKKPITVCPRPGSGGEYDLVCGQGRLEACSQLGETHVRAFVREATPEERYIRSLVENICRKRPHPLQLVQGIADLEKRGYGPAEIAKKVGVCEAHVRNLLRLNAKGEELLLAAVARGDMPVHVAVELASAKSEDLRRCLAEAFERGQLKGAAVARARRLVERRLNGTRREPHRTGEKSSSKKKLTVDEVVRAYKRSTQKQAQLVKKAQICESMLRLVCSALRELCLDEHFVTLLRAEKLEKMPKYLSEQVNKRAAR